MKSAIISIKGMQFGESAEELENSTEFVTEGEYDYSPEKCSFSYLESQLTGLEGTKTFFVVDPEKIMMTRVGTLNSQMVFQEGRKHFFLYDTLFGTITMGIDTYSIYSKFDEKGGDMRVVYSVFMDDMPTSKNEITIKVKEAQ